MKSHIKRGDEVVVLTGSQAGKRGKILELLPQSQRAIVEGVNLIKKSVRPNDDNRQGGFVEREGSLHVSNLMLASKFDERRARSGAGA
jgi:large subunit ribosomal protein L24